MADSTKTKPHSQQGSESENPFFHDSTSGEPTNGLDLSVSVLQDLSPTVDSTLLGDISPVLSDGIANPFDSQVALEAVSAPATTTVRQANTFPTLQLNTRQSFPSRQPIVSPKRNRGMSLRSQLLNRKIEKNIRAAYQLSRPEYTESIEMQNTAGSGDSLPAEDSDDGARARRPAASKPLVRKQKTYSINRLIDSIKYRMGYLGSRVSKSGRKIPVKFAEFEYKDFLRHNAQYADDVGPDSIGYYFNGKTNALVDERTLRVYVDNRIVSSRYNLFNFLPKQLYAQFSKVANIYFMTIAVMQLIPNWSTTGTTTTIIPLSIFMGISMAREGIDDLRRHAQDKQENCKRVRVLYADHDEAQRQLRRSRNSTSSRRSDHSVSSVTRLNEDIETAKDGTGSPEFVIGEEHDEDAGSVSSTDISSSTALNAVGIAEKQVLWKNLTVGSIVRLSQDEPVPADFIVLTSDNPNDEVFVETMDLDGETNLKTKLPHPELAKICSDSLGLAGVNAVITTEDPNKNLYNFEGHFIANNHKHPLNNENIVYRGSVIRNTNCVIGVTVFTGEESKIRMNAIKNPRTKAPHLQKYINMIIIFMIMVVVGLSIGSFVAQRLIFKHIKNRHWYIYQQDVGAMPTFMSFLIMYNTLIPLSLYVTLELIKIGQLLFLQYDIDLYDPVTNTPAEAKTATILEELGQVSYIFSDKTGTLTDNLMLFRKFSVAGVPWLHNLDLVLAQMKQEQDLASSKSTADSSDRLSKDRGSMDIRKGTGTSHYSGRPSMAEIPMQDFLTASGLSTPRLDLLLSPINTAHDGGPATIRTSIELVNYLRTHPHTTYGKRASFFILSLALCHTCFPKHLAHEFEDEIEYQSSSPDELALVAAARDMGFVVYEKKQNVLVVKTYPDGLDQPPQLQKYEVLDVVEFNSVRKRMSCVVRFPDGRICLITKGADNVILQRLRASYHSTEVTEKIAKSTEVRKQAEAKLLISERNSKSFEMFGKRSFSGRSSTNVTDGMVNEMLFEPQERMSSEMDRIAESSRKSLHLDQQRRYHITPRMSGISNINEYLLDEALMANDQYVTEKTLEHVDEFSTDGLRTLLYGFKWLSDREYQEFAKEYSEAKTALTDRQEKLDAVGERLETDLELSGATAIEDKLQEGVPDAIEKLHKAGIKMWMLTGDKRETAINIGYSCGLIKNASTVVILSIEDDDESQLLAKMEAAVIEIRNDNVAHCVLVVDGATLTVIENDVSVMNIFMEFGCMADAVICCRASPSQKAKLVTSVKTKYKKAVTLAIGDGANDIAMIQSADIGIGITGKEGLQAARSSDYSIAQFRYLVKLLLVHGRYNYVRTTKFVLFTFYKEFMFYLSQAVFQRNTLFTGTSLYEPWSLSMFNTLFTSLPVLCIGIMEKDLRPATLIANPQLYRQGRENLSFNLPIFLYWMSIATGSSVMITMVSWKVWGETSLIDNTILPNGVLTYIVFVVLLNVKCQMLEMRNRNIVAFLSMGIEVVGVFFWSVLISVLYKDTTSKIYFVQLGFLHEFGRDPTWWAALLFLLVMGLLIDVIIQVMRNWLFPSAVDFYQEFEKRYVLRSKFERLAYNELHQSWEFQQDRSFQKLRHSKIGQKIFKKHPMPDTVVRSSSWIYEDNSMVDESNPHYRIHVLPSGKLHRRRIADSRMTRLGKKLGMVHDGRIGVISEEGEEDVDGYIGEIMKQREGTEDAPKMAASDRGQVIGEEERSIM